MSHPWPCYPVKPPPRGEDLPYDDGVPLETEMHVKQQWLLVHSLALAWEKRQDFYVGGNMFVYYSELQSKQNDFRGPDVFVVLDTVKKVRRSWVVWEEGGRTPDVVIELTSPSTEATDRGEKRHIYARVLRVAEYFLYDPIEHRLEGYALDSGTGEYVAMTPDHRGWYRSKMLGLWLGVLPGRFVDVEEQWLRWIDDDGRVVPSSEERAEAASAERDGAVAWANETVAGARSRLVAAARAMITSGMSKEQAASTVGIEESELD